MDELEALGIKDGDTVIYSTACIPPSASYSQDNEIKNIFPQKIRPENKLFALILLLIVIPGTALGCVLWRKRKKDPEKELRQKELERIANALKQNLYRPEELERLLRSDVASFLSPGATPAEIAENLEDDELKEAFEKCGQNGKNCTFPIFGEKSFS